MGHALITVKLGFSAGRETGLNFARDDGGSLESSRPKMTNPGYGAVTGTE